jgi:ABC-2 type transport system permease protein
MSATTTYTRHEGLAASESPWRQQLRLYALEAKSELLKALRMPAYSLPTLAFPCVFYLFFGVAFGGQSMGPASMASYLIATYGAWGVIGASLFGFGVGVATERGQGWMLVKRATPMPPSAYFAAKTAMSLLFGLVIVLLLTTLGVAFGGVRMSLATWGGLAGTPVAGAIPFCALGLWLGYLAGPNSAPAIINLVYLPMSFCSGLWLPIQFLPGFLKRGAAFLPSYHLAQLALRWLGADQGGRPSVHVLALIGFTVLFLAAARWAYLRDEGKTYG